MKLFNSKYIKAFLIVIYAVTVLVMCRYAKKNTYYDLDIVMYTACALENESMSHQEIHDKAYNIAKNDLGVKRFKGLIDSTKYYRNSIYKSAENFYGQLPIYRVKPLYVYILKAVYYCGFSPILFSTYINLIAYLIISASLLAYLICYLNFFKAYIVSLCTILLPMVLDSVKNNTPDMLTAFFIFFAILLLLSPTKFKKNLAIILFCLLIFTRPENIIFVVVFCAICYLYKLPQYSKMYLFTLLSLSLLCFASFYYQGYSWSLLYKHSFLGYIPDIQSASKSLTFKGYMNGLRYIPNTVFHSHFFLILLFLIFTVLNYINASPRNNLLRVAYALLISIVIRLALFPDLSIRFYTGIFIVSIVLFFRSLEKEKVLNEEL